IGHSYTDDRFAQNWLGARAAGIFRAAYHVLRPDHDPVAQIDRFASVVGEAGDLPHVLDVELTGEQPDRVIRERTLACLRELEGRFGRKPLVYTADWFWTPHIGAQPGVADYDLWVAHYYWPTVQEPKVPAGWSTWRLWQHSNRGQVAGIPARVDLDFFGGTMEELIAYAGGDPNPPPPPGIEPRVRNLERWAGELDAWARGQGYDGVRPTGIG
ncbi:MAG: GH25 family lysozyme, partial [Anaerolineales bacterium]